MYYKKNETKKNYQLYRCYLINACLAFFLSFLAFEMLFLLFKFFSYNIERCIISEFKIQSSTNSSTLASIRNLCWINGIEREYFNYKMPEHDEFVLENLEKNLKFGDGFVDKPIIKLEFDERRNFQIIAFISLIVILTQITFYYLQKRFNYFLPIIQRLKERSILSYSTNDRQYISMEIQRLMEKSTIYFCVAITFKLVYFILLIMFICAYKLILVGQFKDLNFNLLDTKFWLELISFPTIHKFNIIPKDAKNVIQYSQLNSADILNKLYFILWLSFIVIFVLFIILILTRIIEYFTLNLRNRTILLFAPNCDRNLIKMLNSQIGNYFLLHKIARNITPFRFNLLIETVFYVKDGEIEELDDIIDDQINNTKNSNIKKEQLTEKKNDEQLINVNVDEMKMNRKKNEQHFINNQNYDEDAFKKNISLKPFNQIDHFRISPTKQQIVSTNEQDKLANKQEINVDIENREDNS